MDLPPESLHATLHFTPDDLEANRRGAFSQSQREIVVLLGKVLFKQAIAYAPARPARTATQPLPQIHVVTGRVHIVNETRFARGLGPSGGAIVESFYLIVRDGERDIELPVLPDAAHAFDPDRTYTVYYYMNKGIPTLLSVNPES